MSAICLHVYIKNDIDVNKDVYVDIYSVYNNL